MPIDSVPPPPKPPTPPPTRLIKDCGGDFKWTKWESIKAILLFLLIFLAIPPAAKFYMWWVAIWS